MLLRASHACLAMVFNSFVHFLSWQANVLAPHEVPVIVATKHHCLNLVTKLTLMGGLDGDLQLFCSDEVYQSLK